MVALVAGSIYAVFISDETSGEIKISQVVSELEAEYVDKLNELVNQYTHDYCIYEGEKSNWKDVIAVYAVKLNLDPENPIEVATFNEEKAGQLKAIFWDMNSLNVSIEEVIEIKIHTEIQTDGSIIEVKTEIIRVCLHIISTSIPVDEAACIYNFTNKQTEELYKLINGDFDFAKFIN